MGGWAMDRKRFSIGAIELFKTGMPYWRLTVRLPPNAKRGSRFNDNGDILARVESACKEEDFMNCPGVRVKEALIDAALCDYWYAYEKDYGSETEPFKTEIAGGEDE